MSESSDHYSQAGSVLPEIAQEQNVEPVRTCSASGCMEKTAARGLCWKHYQRRRRNGDEETILRRYGLSHECRYCGATNPNEFYPTYKSICKDCRKVRTIQRGQDRRWNS